MNTAIRPSPFSAFSVLSAYQTPSSTRRAQVFVFTDNAPVEYSTGFAPETERRERKTPVSGQNPCEPGAKSSTGSPRKAPETLGISATKNRHESRFDEGDWWCSQDTNPEPFSIGCPQFWLFVHNLGAASIHPRAEAVHPRQGRWARTGRRPVGAISHFAKLTYSLPERAVRNALRKACPVSSRNAGSTTTLSPNA